MKKSFLITIAWIISLHVFAQDEPTPSQNPSSSTTTNPPPRDRKTAKKERINNLMRMEEEGDLIFNKHGLFGIKLATDGYGIFYERGKFKTNYRTFLMQFELNEKKSPKDHKVATGYFNGYSFNSVVIGKLNNFYQFKVSVGQQHLIGGKGNKNGVAVTALYTGGLSLGILKPYLYDVATPNNNDARLKYPQIIDSGYTMGITGAAGFTVGWNQAQVKPGLNAKQALRFDYGRFNQNITAIEAGISEEYYFSEIPMMYLVPNKHFFFNAYVTIMFGRRK
ncbi:MAG TPA: hypothetical protein VFV08_16995 [Puia sp.]|nr:hypothetical protein [Puia sp.]